MRIQVVPRVFGEGDDNENSTRPFARARTEEALQSQEAGFRKPALHLLAR